MFAANLEARDLNEAYELQDAFEAAFEAVVDLQGQDGVSDEDMLEAGEEAPRWRLER